MFLTGILHCATSELSPRLAVIGAGPAGFSFMTAMLKSLPKCRIDIFDKSPVPYGLIRYGVAPDHPEVKNVIHDYEKTMHKFRAQVNFYGNVHINDGEMTSQDVLNIDELEKEYDVVILTTGAENERKFDVQGIQQIHNHFSARRFVGWYNGLPRDSQLNPNLGGEHAVIIGHGNVALDVARMLLLPMSVLQKTDICDHALQKLSLSRINKVTLIGRRGALQVAFTSKEMREMINLPGCSAQNIDLNFDISILNSLPRPRKRLTDLLIKAAKNESNSNYEKCWTLKFLTSPKSVQLDENNRINVTLQVNKLDNDAAENAKIIPQDVFDEITCDLLISSVGYRSLPIFGLPFDERRNVIETESGNGGKLVNKPNVYACGWCAKGPVGVLASTQLEAKSCAKIVVNDILEGRLSLKDSQNGRVIAWLSERNVFSWENWMQIDRFEQQSAVNSQAPRKKLVHFHTFCK